MHIVRMQLSIYMAEKGLSDDDLAEMVGFDRSTISRVRRGKTRPSWDLIAELERVSRGFVTATDFVGGPR